MPPLRLLTIDTAYTFEAIRIRGIEDAITSLELEGFFERAWTVHPIASLTTSSEWSPRNGPPVEYRLSDRHVFVEGKIGRYDLPPFLFVFNFLASQIGLLLHLRRLVLREKIRVLRAGDPLYSGLMAWALARLTKRPFMIRLGADHDLFFEVTGKPVMPRLFRRRSIERKVERFVMRRADLIAGATREYLTFAKAAGVPEERLTVFPYGNLLDRRHFEAPSARGLDPNLLDEIGVQPGKFILYVGRLLPGKRPDDVLKALVELRARGHDLKAVLVGEGDCRPHLEAFAAQRGLTNQVVLAGNRPQSWLAQIIPQAAAFVSPVTGRALSEAALGAAPIVAYATDWQGELIRQGETGELVPYRDWTALANSVERFLRDPEYASLMGKRVRAAALAMLDRAQLVQNERDQYRRILGSAPHQAEAAR